MACTIYVGACVRACVSACVCVYLVRVYVLVMAVRVAVFVLWKCSLDLRFLQGAGR